MFNGGGNVFCLLYGGDRGATPDGYERTEMQVLIIIHSAVGLSVRAGEIGKPTAQTIDESEIIRLNTHPSALRCLRYGLSTYEIRTNLRVYVVKRIDVRVERIRMYVSIPRIL